MKNPRRRMEAQITSLQGTISSQKFKTGVVRSKKAHISDTDSAAQNVPVTI